jgi:hypothetical protein
MIIRDPIFPNDGESIEIVFAYSETEIYHTPNIPRGIFTYDGFHCTVFFSKEFKDWLDTNIGINNYHLSYTMGYRVRFKNKTDAMMFKLVWV